MPTPQLSIAFDPAIEELLRLEAEQRHVSMSFIVREIVARHFTHFNGAHGFSADSAVGATMTAEGSSYVCAH